MPKYRKPLPAELPVPETVDPAALGTAWLQGDIDMVVVLGPTASGKTKYAVRLAKALGEGCPDPSRREAEPVPVRAEIISADSRQVYRGMDIGTGKDLAEYDGIPCHLIDIRDAGSQYNVYEFCEDFRRAYDDIRSRGALPVLCGGTGLYIHAATAGYDFRSSKPLSEKSGADSPVAPSDGIRSYFIGTLVSRDVRNARIDARLKARLEEGMIDEIRGLLDGTNPGCRDGKPVPAETLISYGLEYKFVTRYLLGQLSYEQMAGSLSTAIHQFAKRQMTWFRGMERSGVRIHWVQV